MFKYIIPILIIAFSVQAEERDKSIDVLSVFSAAGHKTPIGGVGVYTRPYNKRIGRIETLGDGSTVLRGAYGRVVARSEPRRRSSDPIRITIKKTK